MTLDEYYNKFNEDKRLETRRGQVEYITSLKYIHDYLKRDSKVLDIGAGTGKYSLQLYKEGYDVTAIELVKHNLQVIKLKNKNLKAYQGDATDLKKIQDNSYDVTLLFGPMYHLKNIDDQISALREAKRVTKKYGTILVAYCMNEYALLTYGFKDGNILDNIKNKEVDDNFHITKEGNQLYNYVRLEDINNINKKCNIERIKIISADGPSSYIKECLNKMDNQTFKIFLDYHLKTCERMDLIGACTHTIDILKNK